MLEHTRVEHLSCFDSFTCPKFTAQQNKLCCPLPCMHKCNVFKRRWLIVSYPMLRMTHPSRNFCSLFVLFLCMLVRLRMQGFESSVNKKFQKKKLVNSKTIIYGPHLKGLVHQEANLVHLFCYGRKFRTRKVVKTSLVLHSGTLLHCSQH